MGFCEISALIAAIPPLKLILSPFRSGGFFIFKAKLSSQQDDGILFMLLENISEDTFPEVLIKTGNDSICAILLPVEEKTSKESKDEGKYDGTGTLTLLTSEMSSTKFAAGYVLYNNPPALK